MDRLGWIFEMMDRLMRGGVGGLGGCQVTKLR